jgi:hypothetical protein
LSRSRHVCRDFRQSLGRLNAGDDSTAISGDGSRWRVVPFGCRGLPRCPWVTGDHGYSEHAHLGTDTRKDAYGWPATLSDDGILERLVALNHERAAEEKRGLVRWLRPEFQTKLQDKTAGGDVQREFDPAAADDDGFDAGDEPTPAKPNRGKRAVKKSTATDAAGEPAKQNRVKKPKAAKQAWPKDLAEQTRAVWAALAAAGGIMTAADVACGFKHAKQPRVEEILATLVALGHARRTDSGYAPA